MAVHLDRRAEGSGIRGEFVFTFSHHPTAITVSDGLQDAFLYLQRSWRIWLPVVGVIAAGALVTHALVGSLDPSTLYQQDPYTGRFVWDQDALNRWYGVAAASLVVGLLSVIGGWVFSATAIAGLRNRPVTLSGVVVRGLVTLVSGLVMAAVAILVLTGLIAAGIAVTLVAPPLGLLLMLLLTMTGIPVGIYVVIRVIFTGLAIFDGFGPIAGIRESWRLSQGSVSRMLGWGALAFLVTIGIGILAGIIVAPFGGSGLKPVADAASTAVTMAGSGLIVFMMAVLYESERARKDPTLYPVPAWPGYGSYPAGPYAPGPAPAWPGPYAQGPYPTDPTAIPGWVGPNGPAPAWPTAPYAGGPYPANANAMPGWVAPGPAPAWANIPANPASLDPAAPGPEPAQTGNSNETDPNQQPPNATQSPEAPAS